MTSWPKDLKPAHFDALTIPIVKAIEDANYHERRCEEVDIEWKGLPYTLKCLKVSCLDPEKTLKAKNLERCLEDGITPLQEIVAIAIRTGIEQGFRIALDNVQELRASFIKEVELS